MVTYASAVDDGAGAATPRRPGVAGGLGAADPSTSCHATSTAARIADTEHLIARLENDLAEAAAAGEAARDTRATHALAAAEGDPAARAALQTASEASARLEVGRENIVMALTAARARLATLEEERRREEREALRRKNVATCHQRIALAGRIDALLAEMAPLVEQWSGLGTELYGSAADKPGVVGGGLAFLNTKFFARALPAPVAKALGLKHFAPDHTPLAQGDPASMTTRHVAGVAEPVGRQYPDALSMLGNPAPPAEPETEAEVAAAPPPEPRSRATDPVAARRPPVAVPSVAIEAALAGRRVVGRLAGGGAVWEAVRPGEPPATAA
jgi:hypothetical protein